MSLVLKYGLFAVFAIILNIAGQEASLLIYAGSYSLMLSIFVGTAVGLVVKYVLDKRYIFKFYNQDVGDDLNKFALYTLTGVVTTLIFWGTELGFDAVFDNKIARYTGALIGLTLGYILKYRLDKRFVFTTDASGTTKSVYD